MCVRAMGYEFIIEMISQKSIRKLRKPGGTLDIAKVARDNCLIM